MTGLPRLRSGRASHRPSSRVIVAALMIAWIVDQVAWAATRLAAGRWWAAVFVALWVSLFSIWRRKYRTGRADQEKRRSTSERLAIPHALVWATITVVLTLAVMQWVSFP